MAEFIALIFIVNFVKVHAILASNRVISPKNLQYFSKGPNVFFCYLAPIASDITKNLHKCSLLMRLRAKGDALFILVCIIVQLAFSDDRLKC